VHVTKRVITTVTTTNQAMMIAVIAVTREQKDARSAINMCEARSVTEMKENFFRCHKRDLPVILLSFTRVD